MINSGRTITDFVKQKTKELSGITPDKVSLSLVRVAEFKNIPYRTFASASRIWQFGQGARSFQFLKAVTSNNEVPGNALSKNKAHTNQVIKSLGFLTTQCVSTNKLDAGKIISKTIGFPVVVKPLYGSRGQGVTTNITHDAEFETAFKKAMGGGFAGSIDREPC